MDQLEISIVIPCYNDAAHIREAVQYARKQTFPGIEVILVDDGSNQETKQVIATLKPQLDLLITQENCGPGAARNRGIEAARGRFILVWDSDDFFEREFCSTARQVLDDSPTVKIVGSWARRVFRDGSFDIYKPEGGNLENFLLFNAAMGSAMFRKEDWKKIGGYDETMRVGFEDWEFYIRLLREGGEAHVVQEVLFNYRMNNNLRTAGANRKKYDLQKYIFLKHKDLYINHFEKFVSHLMNKIEREEIERKKILDRYEYKVGKAIISPLRKLKNFFTAREK